MIHFLSFQSNLVIKLNAWMKFSNCKVRLSLPLTTFHPSNLPSSFLISASDSLRYSLSDIIVYPLRVQSTCLLYISVLRNESLWAADYEYTSAYRNIVLGTSHDKAREYLFLRLIYFKEWWIWVSAPSPYDESVRTRSLKRALCCVNASDSRPSNTLW